MLIFSLRGKYKSNLAHEISITAIRTRYPAIANCLDEQLIGVFV